MRIRTGILILIIAATCLASYFNTLFADFVWDDVIFISENPYIKSFKFLPQFFAKDFWSIYISSMPSPYYRPLLAVSFMLDYALWQGNPLGFHLTNLILHALAGILIFIFLELLARNRFIAFIASMVFIVHPVHTEVVSFVSGRVDSLSLVFFLLSLVLFLKYASAKRAVFYLLSLFCFALSLLSKEMAVTLPLIIICIDYLFLNQCNIKKTIANFWKLHLGFFIILALYLSVRSYVVGWSFFELSALKETNFNIGISSFWRMFTVIKILFLYLRLLFFPYGLKLIYSFFSANSLFEPAVLIGLLLLSFFIYIATKNTKRYPMLSFSIFWFFITVLPVSNIIPQGNIFAERYIYTPSVGFCIGVAFLFSWLLNKNVKMHRLNWKYSLYALFFLLVIALGRVTYERNKVWESNLTLWYDAVNKSPYSTQARTNLAHDYYRMNLLDRALAEAKVALELDSNDYYAAYLLASTYLKKGLIDEAIDEFKKAIEMSVDRAEAYDGLAVAYGIKGQYEQAIEAGLFALTKDPGLEGARYNLALNYQKAGFVDEAIDMYEEYLRINPDYPGVYFEVGNLYNSKGHPQKAKDYWLRALEISEDYQPAKEALRLLEK